MMVEEQCESMCSFFMRTIAPLIDQATVNHSTISGKCRTSRIFLMQFDLRARYEWLQSSSLIRGSCHMNPLVAHRTSSGQLVAAED